MCADINVSDYTDSSQRERSNLSAVGLLDHKLEAFN